MHLTKSVFAAIIFSMVALAQAHDSSFSGSICIEPDVW